MSESVIPAVLLRALSEYKFVGHPLWRMADGKDHVRVELTFHKTLPTLPVYKRRAESRRQPAPSAGEWPRQPTAARQPHRRRPDRRLQHADSRQRRRRQHRQHRRYYRSTQLPSQNQDHQRQHGSRHQPSSRDQLHRLLVRNRHRQRSREQSRRRRTLHPRSTFMSALRNTLYMKSTSSRMSHLQSSRPSQKLED